MTAKIIVLLCLTVGSTVMHGLATDRWGPSPELQRSADFVKALPKQLGQWKYVKDAEPLTPRVIKELGVNGHVSRVYSSGQTIITLLLMSGKTARLVRHTPDICYASTGNTFLAEPTPAELTVDGTRQEFLVLPVQTQLDEEFVVVYGYATDGHLSSPKSPRLRYHGQTVIQKFQVLSEYNSDAPTSIPGPAENFLTELCRYYVATAND